MTSQHRYRAADLDGQFYPLDVLVLATGFRPDRFVRPVRVIGATAPISRKNDILIRYPNAAW